MEALVGATEDWIESFIRPQISSPEGIQNALSAAQHYSPQRHLEKTFNLRNLDFKTASQFPGSDSSIILSIIFDFLGQHVFSSECIMYHCTKIQEQLNFISALEKIMHTAPDPRDTRCKPLILGARV